MILGECHISSRTAHTLDRSRGVDGSPFEGHLMHYDYLPIMKGARSRYICTTDLKFATAEDGSAAEGEESAVQVVRERRNRFSASALYGT